MGRTEMMANMPSSEFDEWIAFEKLHGPLGPDRNDVPLAMISQILMAIAGRSMRLIDFMPYMDIKQPVQSLESMKANVAAYKRHLEKRNGNNRKRGRQSIG